MAAVASCLSFAVASSFGLSAGWKVLHRGDFEAAFYGMAPLRLRRFSQVALGPVVALESAVAALLVAGTLVPVVWILGDTVAVVALIGFSATLYRADEIEDCGCWSMPSVADGRTRRNLTLLRNAVLLLILLTAIALPHQIHLDPAFAFAFGAGLLVGLLVTELPQVVVVATFSRGSTA